MKATYRSGETISLINDLINKGFGFEKECNNGDTLLEVHGNNFDAGVYVDPNQPYGFDYQFFIRMDGVTEFLTGRNYRKIEKLLNTIR